MIGDNIRRLMYENDYTQTELATRSECGKGDISRYINNKVIPRIETLRKLSLALGVTVEDLVNGGKNVK